MTFRPARGWRRRSTSCTGARTSIPTPRRSSQSAGSVSGPTRTPTCRSAVACAAAWVPALPRPRCGWCSARSSPTCGSRPRARRARRSAAGSSRWFRGAVAGLSLNDYPLPARECEQRHAVSHMTPAPERLTRKQRQEHTRTCLLDAAGRVFARRGLTQASVDEVAADAGFTKGAVYANFGSKEELFLAMLDVRFAHRLDEMDRALSTDESPEVQARAAGRDFITYLAGDPEWGRLFFEAALHASRDEAFRIKLQQRYAQMRERMAAVLRARAEAGGFDPGVPFDQLATMI